MAIKMLQKTDITVSELATILSVKPRSVLRWIESGKVVAFQLPGGGGYRISLTEVERIRQPV